MQNRPQVSITSKMEITPAIREHVETRIKKLEKWKTQLINPRVTLSKTPNGFSADANIGTPLGQLVAKVESKDMYEALDLLEEKLSRQMNKMQHKGESLRQDK